jgi:hypothetical protein
MNSSMSSIYHLDQAYSDFAHEHYPVKRLNRDVYPVRSCDEVVREKSLMEKIDVFELDGPRTFFWLTSESSTDEPSVIESEI